MIRSDLGRRRLSIALWAVVCLVVLLALFWFSRVPNVAPGAQPRATSPGESDANERPALDGSVAVRSVLPDELKRSISVLRGRVIDELFGLPVRARVTPDVGSVALSHAATG